MFESKIIEKTGYGYSIENPIKAFNVLGSYGYIKCLKPNDGVMFKYERAGCVEGLNGKLLDQYFIWVLDNEGKLKRYTIYIDMYHLKTDTVAPEDFTFEGAPF